MSTIFEELLEMGEIGCTYTKVDDYFNLESPEYRTFSAEQVQ